MAVEWKRILTTDDLHSAVTVSAPISLSGQALSLVNDAAGTITEIDTGALANSDTAIPTSKAVTTAIAGVTGGSISPVIRQTVLSSKTSSGLPIFITDPNDGLKVNIDTDVGTPVVIAFAAGFGTTGPIDYIGAIESDTNISSLTDDSTCYLYASRNSGTGAITLGHVIVAPVYNYVAPAHAASQYWFSISDMKMYLSNGTNTWTEGQVVFLGEAVTASGQVTSVVNYALCGRYDSGWFAVATETDYSKNHNIGVKMPWVTIYGAYVDFDTQGEPPAWVYISGSGYFGVRRLVSDSSKVVACQTQAFIFYDGGWQTTNCYLRILVNRGW